MKTAFIFLVTVLVATSLGQRPLDPRVKPGHNPARVERSDRIWLGARAEISVRPHAKPGSAREFDPSSAKLIRGDVKERIVALTFDDGPHPYYTEALIDVLKREKAPATFFVVGKMVEKYPELAKAIVKNGFEIANHTFSHATLTDLPPADVAVEYQANSDVIYEATGVRPKFCRPPGGRYNDGVVRTAWDLGMTTALWTDDPGDFKRILPAKLAKDTASRLSPGGIVLLHSGVKETLEILPELIHIARARGFRIVPLAELAASARHESNAVVLRR